jgi:hypothetical protein
MIAGDIMRCIPYAWRELEVHVGAVAEDEDEDDE